METTQTTTKYPMLAAFQDGKPPVQAAATETKVAHTQDSAADPAPAPAVEPSPAATTTPATPAADVTEPTPAPASPAEEMTEAQVLKAFNKMNGTSYKSMAEIVPPKVKTKEEIEQEEVKFKNDSLAWAFEAKNLDREKYEKSIVEKSKSARDIALAAFGANLLQEDSKLSPAEIEELFKDVYHEDKDADSRLYKLGQQRMKAEADAYLKSNYGDLDGIENEYRDHLTGAERYRAYGKEVKNFFNQAPVNDKVSFEYTHANGKKESINIDYEVTDADRKAVQKQFESDDMYFALGASEGTLNEKAMKVAYDRLMKAQIFDRVITDVAVSVADRTALETMAYLKGIKTDAPSSVPGVTRAAATESAAAPRYPMLAEAQKKQGY